MDIRKFARHVIKEGGGFRVALQVLEDKYRAAKTKDGKARLDKLARVTYSKRVMFAGRP